MTTRTRQLSWARGPAFIGTVTAVVALLAGWIAYRAQDGLPWQRHYHVTVNLPDADRLIKNDDVKIAGVRVGQVSRVIAVRSAADGRPVARVALSLDRDVGTLPVDSRVQVRPASVLGASFVAIEPGDAQRRVPDGGTLRVTTGQPRNVELTDLFDVFDRETSRSIRRGFTDLGDGLAGRGGALNDVLGALTVAFPRLDSVSRVLAAPQTRLGPMIAAYRRVIDAIASPGESLGGLMKGGADTFAALNAGHGTALGRAIDVAPSAEQAATVAFRELLPSLASVRRAVRDLTPASRVLKPALRSTAQALRAGVPALRRTSRLSHDLDTTFRALAPLVDDPSVGGALRKLRELVIPSLESLRPIAEAQLQCNSLGLYGETMGSLWSGVGVGDGPSMPTALVTTLGAQNEIFQNSHPSSNLGYNPEPHADANECESGNEPWTGKQSLGNPAGYQSKTTRTSVPPPGVRELARRAGLLQEEPPR